MKLILLLSLLAPVMSFAQTTTPAEVCGQVVVGDQCDVDFCWIRFVPAGVKPGQELGIMDGGMMFTHEGEADRLTPYKDKNVCVDADKIDHAYGQVDIKDLRIK